MKLGDYVEVLDPNLLMLAKIANREPDNKGWINDIDNDTIYVEFPIGNDPIDEHSQCAPYPKRMVRVIAGPTRDEYRMGRERVNE